MSFERYLLATVAALKNDVLPTLAPSPARDQVINCLRVLTRMSIGMEASPQDAQAAFDDARLPAEIRSAFAQTAADTPPLAEEVAVCASTVSGMNAASHWLATQPWCDNPEQGQIARSLLAWESTQRNTRLARMAAAEQADENTASTVSSGANLSEATLREWLRRRLNNPALKITDYRQLTGGRTRKTVLFQQTGQADWPEWLVIQCDPPVGYHAFPGVVSQYPTPRPSARRS